MKLTIMLVFVFTLNATAFVHSQDIKLNLNLSNVKIQDVFDQIEGQSEFNVFYKTGEIDVNKPITIHASNISLSEVLDLISKESGIRYKVIDKIIVVTPSNLLFQSRKISGTVSDGLTGEPLVGVNVVIEGTTIGVTTDADGKYSIEVPTENSVLIMSFVGYNTERVNLGGQTNLDVKLTPDIKSLSEVVVIGYGTQKKADITGAVANVSSDELNQGINQSVSHALQGRVSGVAAIQNSGEPGAGVEIRIRGAGSINDNSPLYVVDGIIVDGISKLNPADIESMSVLKDAASAAIYGSRGANGVVIVTTRKGKRGEKTNISYNTSHGIQQAWKLPESLTAAERNMIHTEALTNDGTPSNESVWDYYNNPNNAVTRTDWFDKVFRPAYIASHDLSIRGGNQNSNYSFSLGYLDNDGIVDKTGYKRYNIRFNSQFELLKNLTLGENIGVFFSRQKMADIRSDYDGVLSAALFNMRNTPVWEDEANQIYGLPAGDFPNPVASLNSKDNVQKNYGASGNLYMEYKFWNAFTLKTDLGYNWNFRKDKSFTAIATNGGRGLDQNSLYEYYETRNTFIWNNTLTFDKKLNRHHIAGLAGMSMESGLTEGTNTGTAKQFSNQEEALRYFNNAGSFPNHPFGGADDYALLSYFGRVSYEFADKYLFAANIRADGSSKFPEDKRWGVFPSVSGGWRISEESFFKSLKNVVSDAKIRASWGQLGNDKIPNYQYYSTVSTVGSPTLGGQPFTAVAQNRFANSDIKWEVTTQTDVGVDLGLLNNKIIITADYFDKETSDILVQVPLVSSLGVGEAPFRNAGKVSNKGYDLGISYHNNDNEFKYEITTNLSQVKNKLESLGVSGAKEIFISNYKNTYVGRIAEGEPIGHFYVLRALGLFQSQNEIDSYKNSDGELIQPNAQPGDVKFDDVNKDGVINADDRINAGNSFPTFTYSMNLSAEYKGFDLSMLWVGSKGNKIFNGLKLGGVFMQGTSYNNSPEILDRWTPTSKGNSVPRVTVKDLNNNKAYNTLYVEDGSYARLKYLTLGYTFKEKFTGKRINKLRVYLTLQNPITITKYKGFDPEIGSDSGVYSNIYGVDRGTYPQARAYIVGFNLNF